GVVDTTVGGRVDLDHVDRAAAAGRQVPAAVALTAGLGRGRLRAVERTREDPRRRRLAAATGTGEEVGVVDPVVRQGVAQRVRDVVLPDDLGERLGPVTAIESEGCVHV